MSATASHPGTVAGVYAAALLAVAAERGTTEAVVAAARELPASFDPATVGQLDDPRLGKAKAKEVLGAALAGAPREIRDLVLLLVDKNRLADARAILREAVAQHEAATNVVHFKVRSAVPMTGIALERFQARIRKTHGDRAVLDQQIDPSVIGGFTARLGDLYIDASVRRRLNEMRLRMLATQLPDDALWAQ